MKNLYQITRHLVWLTQFGLSVALPPVLFLLGAVWLKNEFALGGWVVLVGLLLGLAGSVGSLRSNLKSIDREGKEDTPRTPPPISFNNHEIYYCEVIPTMQKNRDVLRQVGGLAVALLVCIAVMLAVYALLGRLDRLVLLGAVFGWILAVGNFLSLSITVSNALDRAANGGSPQKAQLEIQTSSVVRPLVLALIYIVLFRAKVCDPVAALLPLLFAQVAIKVLEFFRNDKKGGDTAP